MSKVKILKTSLVIVLIALITFGVGITLALNSNEVKIEISEVPNIDVVLSKAKTNVNLSTFEKDLKDKLEEEGVDLSKVKISTVETSTLDSSQESGAEQIYNTWKKVGRYPGSWTVDSTNKTIVNSNNTVDLTGYVAPGENYSDLVIEYEAQGIPYAGGYDDDMFGALIKYTENEDGTVSTYLFLIGGTVGGTSALGQAGKDGYTGTFYTGLYKINHGKGSKGSFTLSSIEGYKLNGTTSSITPLARSTKNWSQGVWSTYKIETKENNIKIYMDNQLIINYTDNNDPILEGSYGLVTYSQEAQ